MERLVYFFSNTLSVLPLVLNIFALIEFVEYIFFSYANHME